MHLRPQVLIDAAEAETAAERPATPDAPGTPGRLTHAVRAHLDRCDRCAARVRETRAAIAAARGLADMPEPSPLFWDHLSARVRHATAADPVADRRSWGRAAWVPLVAGALAAAVMLMSPEEGTPGGPTPVVLGDDSWEAVLAGAHGLSPDEVQAVAPWASPATLVADLTPAEREVFARLLEREMTDVQP
jgi:anti-sigma factor RsiW